MQLRVLATVLVLLGSAIDVSAQDPEFARQVASSQREAMIAFPDLGKPGTELNKRFVSEYQRLGATSDALLKNPDWPRILAKRAAEDLGVQPSVTAAKAPAAPPARTGSFHPGDAPSALSSGPPGSTGGLNAPGLNAPASGRHVTICGHVLQKISEGLLVTCAADNYERHLIPRAPRRGVIGAEYAEGTVLLTGCPREAGMADDQSIGNIVARDAGLLEYQTESGAKKTVHAFQYVTGQ